VTTPLQKVTAAVSRRLKGLAYRSHTFALRAELVSGGASIHPTASLGRFSFVGEPALLRIGRGAVVNDHVLLSAVAPLVIGDYASISAHVQVHTGYLEAEGRPRVHAYAPVTIGDNAWVASGAIISPGVTIGENAIVGAGAVVTRDVAPDVLVAGVPARFVRRLTPEDSGPPPPG
jgi:acetyltransferase-like isoleucine patch superfamily enzyme